MSDYKVLITTAGVESRLGNITKYTNKALVRVGDKPVISYIIESYPKDVEIVISVGYYAEHIKEFVELAYPDRKIKFVLIDRYEGVGSSMGYSLLKTKKYLQCPFIIHTGDTLVFDDIPKPKYNWNGGYKDSNSSIYRTFNVLGEEIKKINDKGNLEADYIDIGLSGVKDYKDFWSILENLYSTDSGNDGLCECNVFNVMMSNGNYFKVEEFLQWFDAGSVEGLNRIRKKIPSTVEILDKSEESIFLFDKFVIKFFYDQEIIKKRVLRSKVLSGLIPKLDGYKNNFYRYEYVVGDVLSKVVNETNFQEFLKWSKDNLWKKNSEVSSSKFKEICHNFYFEKTQERLNKFRQITSIEDKIDIINGIETPSVGEMLKMIDVDWLCASEQYLFHGDFILDNILKTKGGYCLLDWRQDFGGLIGAGDIYYDLAKLNHNLTINHEMIYKDLFTVETDQKNKIKCDILRKEILVQCQKVFFDFLKEEKFDIKKVNILTSIIWLNMSPLHIYPFNTFLYFFGKLNLWKAINQK